tara:strand:+ start:413 stop:727 length:315 start_codon:yes stop_codon:yes gene_type:complete
MAARDFLDKWLSGSMLDIYSNCNSKFRNLQYFVKNKDQHGINFWTNRIELCSKVRNLLFAAFYHRKDSIKNQQDFDHFMEIFKRYAAIKTRVTWYEIATGGPKR